jgi:UTP:GlnB (protein PII) uridylyltransferase
VVFLVEHHLTMSSVAQKQDVDDPEVARAFAAKVGDERRLVALYLLTVADIRGTSPKVWNGWKAKLLEDLFRMARRVLAGEAPALDTDVARKQAEASACCACTRSPTRSRNASGPTWTPPTSCATTRRRSPGRRATCTTGWTARRRWCARAWRLSARACR